MEKKAEFKIAFDLTEKHEGGYVNNPTDRGGETYKGIARKIWPNWDGWAIVDILKKKYTHKVLDARLASNLGLQGSVEEFYHHNFWNRNKLYEFDQVIANEIYDTGVNQGVGSAAKHFQKTLNKLNRNEKDFPDLVTDGKIGNKTIVAYRAYMATVRFGSRSNKLLISVMWKTLNWYQHERYMKITDRDKIQELFYMGWVARA